MSIRASLKKMEKRLAVLRQARPIPILAFILSEGEREERGIYFREEDQMLCYRDERTGSLVPFEGGVPILPSDPTIPTPRNLTYAL